MKTEYMYAAGAVGLVAFILLVWMLTKKEGLSESQFPIPTCSTCKSCAFYSCGKCGTIYQEQNKEGQPCDCGGFTVYKTREQPSCYRQTLKGGPNNVSIRTCDKCENMQGPPVPTRQSSCTSCDSDDHVCLQAAGTFDSGSTWMRNLPCPVPFPPVTEGYKIVAHKQNMHASELDVYKCLEDGGLLVAAKNGKVAEYTLKKLIEETETRGLQGYPNFYYIDGPIVVMTKVDGMYFWMIDYPIKYNPQNFKNYVGMSTDWNIAKTALKNGRKLLDNDAPFFFLSADHRARANVRASAFACLPEGNAQSTTDYYYPGCNSKSCLWGPDYGSGNWLMRV